MKDTIEAKRTMNETNMIRSETTASETAQSQSHLDAGALQNAAARAAKEQRDLNEVVHEMLIIGLVISTVLMMIGLVLDLALGVKPPETTSSMGEALRRVLALQPSGFLTLGLLVLIATPILRVMGSIAAFVYEHDWRYALITLIVLIVVMLSLALGNG